MSKKSDVETEMEDLIKRDVSIEWLHKESHRLAYKLMQQFPNTWKKEIEKMYTYTAVCRLINIKRQEK